ncbi:class I SAM-dependent methyltransferase [Streptomyces sp. SAJ15]|uniref:class I SAM-dependent methyltransferase n=1 Tax=Streptomyces sp. SAJ15 TaxID=2011095 RepID=UPI0011871066|nr:class I SAM-dependent methyltransferase [Streptomyces sp. SAJ15]TVL94081.1 SAM-dependent methyltransferase [Streptomyces sp. SAJ15]
MADTVAAAPHWTAWQDSWDRQQEWYLPDREERFRVMLDSVEALVGPEPRVLDLACGTGSISARLLRRFPGATSVGVDRDPALLAIARGSFAAEPRVRFVTVDLLDPRWTEALPHSSYDAVLTATALHWMDGAALRTLYGQLARLLPDGGVFLNADHMPDESTPRLNAAERSYRRAARQRAKDAGAQDWADWWRALAADPALAEVTAERFARYGDPSAGDDHGDDPMYPPAWHAAALREAGFDEARAVWCSVTDGLVLALK